MTYLDRKGFPTWAAVVTALLGPILIAVVFLSVFDYANRPTPGPMQPGEGQQISDTNNALIFLHALGQLAFLVAGGWLAGRPRSRVVFLAIAIPVSGLVLLLATVGLIAG